MRTKILIAAAGLLGVMSLPGVAAAQPWGGGFGPPPFHHFHHGFYGPGPGPFPLPPPLIYRPRVYFAPPPLEEPPPPPAYYYAPRPVYHSSRVYVAPHYRSHVVHRTVHRTVQPLAAVPCSCALPSATQPASIAPNLPALRPATPDAPATNVYPPERTQGP